MVCFYRSLGAADRSGTLNPVDMKKTKTIQLVLITAALASCNRHFSLPQPDPDPEYTSDSAWYETPVDSACPMYPSYDDPYYYLYYTGNYLPGWDLNFFFQPQPVMRSPRRGGVVRHLRWIPRGGFGKLAVTTAAS